VFSLVCRLALTQATYSVLVNMDMQEVNLLSVNQESWNELAKNVFAASGLGSNDILITLPYVTCPGIGFDSGYIFYMPGLAFGNNSKIDLSELRQDYSNTQRTAELQAGVQPSSLWEFILDVFTHTHKQYYQRYYYIDFILYDNLFADDLKRL
jgi:hypothetical protein